MSYCEDYPCCGHEDGGCPTINDNGDAVYPCADCGIDLPVNHPSALCHACMAHACVGEDDGCDCDECDCDESMDGDHDSAMASAGHGTDEDYGYFGEMGCNED